MLLVEMRMCYSRRVGGNSQQVDEVEVVQLSWPSIRLDYICKYRIELTIIAKTLERGFGGFCCRRPGWSVLRSSHSINGECCRLLSWKRREAMQVKCADESTQISASRPNLNSSCKQSWDVTQAVAE